MGLASWILDWVGWEIGYWVWKLGIEVRDQEWGLGIGIRGGKLDGANRGKNCFFPSFSPISDARSSNPVSNQFLTLLSARFYERVCPTVRPSLKRG